MEDKFVSNTGSYSALATLRSSSTRVMSGYLPGETVAPETRIDGLWTVESVSQILSELSHFPVVRLGLRPDCILAPLRAARNDFEPFFHATSFR